MRLVAPVALSAPMGGASAGARPYRVVLVDDTEDLRFIMRRVLHSTSRFEVAGEAENGLAAIDVARRAQPDIVLLDLLMPVMDGWEALPRIREAAPRAKIVVVSGQDRSVVGPRALSEGAAAYIEKSVPARDIVRELLRVMDGS